MEYPVNRDTALAVE